MYPAIGILSRLVVKQPQDIDHFSMLAKALLEIGELEEAKEILLSALSIDPDHKISLQYLGKSIIYIYIFSFAMYLLLLVIITSCSVI